VVKPRNDNPPLPTAVDRARGDWDACFIVKDHAGLSLAYVYFEEEPGRLPELLRQ
jgi:hypothetical protein